MTRSAAGPGGEARVWPVSTEGMEKLRGKEVATGVRHLTDTQQKVTKGVRSSRSRERKGARSRPGTARAGARARAPLGPGVVVGGGQEGETELSIVPNPNKPVFVYLLLVYATATDICT